jgi:hypothetical protein
MGRGKMALFQTWMCWIDAKRTIAIYFIAGNRGMALLVVEPVVCALAKFQRTTLCDKRRLVS